MVKLSLAHLVMAGVAAYPSAEVVVTSLSPGSANVANERLLLPYFSIAIIVLCMTSAPQLGRLQMIF